MRAIKTITDACDFVDHWLGLAVPVNGPELRRDLPWPESYRILNARLGGAWGGAGPKLSAATFPGSRPLSIFEIQDHIQSPARLDFAQEVIPLVHENQGVFSFGFRGETLAQSEGVFVKGDRLFIYGMGLEIARPG